MTLSNWKSLAFAALLLTTPALAFGDDDRDDKRRVFAWLANDPNNSYDNATLAGIRDVFTPMGWTVETYFAGFNGTTQLAQCRQAIATKRYTGFFIEAADAVGILPCVAEARQKGIPVVATDLPIGPDTATVQPQVPGQVGASFIPATSWARAVSNIIPQACQGLTRCNVYYLAGLSTFAIDVLGLQAAQQAVAANPNYRLIGSDQAFYTAATAKQIMLNQFTLHPEINVVIASGDQMAIGIEQAATERGLRVKIVGAGAGASAIDAVRQGRWFATFNALPRTEGQIGAVLMRTYLYLGSQALVLGVDPAAYLRLPNMWTQATLAQFPNFIPQWPGA